MKNYKQISKRIIMINPKHFNYNVETADNNHFQKNNIDFSEKKRNEKASLEFKGFIQKLKEKKITVKVYEDREDVKTTDSVFPNNWISFHQEGKIILYPMYSPNRRKERRNDIIEDLKDEGFIIEEIIDLTHYENIGSYLEGTGSMVLDRENKICYAALSERTSHTVLMDLCEKLNYKLIHFHAYQSVKSKRLEIYHTNVLMCLGTEYCIVCLDSIDCKEEEKKLINSLKKTNKQIIEISEDQMNRFAGNMLQVENIYDEKYLIMSSAAYNSLNEKQKKNILYYNEIIHSDLSTIETLGGGSARCMIAENFLEKK